MQIFLVSAPTVIMHVNTVFFSALLLFLDIKGKVCQLYPKCSVYSDSDIVVLDTYINVKQ